MRGKMYYGKADLWHIKLFAKTALGFTKRTAGLVLNNSPPGSHWYADHEGLQTPEGSTTHLHRQKGPVPNGWAI